MIFFKKQIYEFFLNYKNGMTKKNNKYTQKRSR